MSLSSVVADVFIDMNSNDARWLNEDFDSAIERLNECESRESFYETMINTYTKKENYLYTILNTALRRQRGHNYRPTASDLAFGPYILVYQMLLVHWDNLERETAPTYRKMVMHTQDQQRYKVGRDFIWPSFVMSSVVKEKAQSFPTFGPPGEHSVMFTIDNRCQSDWRPRNNESYAQFHENDRVYPAGATFVVTSRTQSGNDVYIGLKLC